MSNLTGISIGTENSIEITETVKTPYCDILEGEVQKEIPAQEQQSRTRREKHYKKLLGVAMMAAEARTYGDPASDIEQIKGKYEDPLHLKELLTSYIDDRIRMNPAKYRNGEDNPKPYPSWKLLCRLLLSIDGPVLSYPYFQ